jgi:hypothetical protein
MLFFNFFLQCLNNQYLQKKYKIFSKNYFSSLFYVPFLSPSLHPFCFFLFFMSLSFPPISFSHYVPLYVPFVSLPFLSLPFFVPFVPWS